MKEEELKIETVCLLSKLHEAKHHVNVRLDMDELDLDELDLTSAESKATYEERKEKLWKSIYGCSKNYISY